jgi:hypothetical protein
MHRIFPGYPPADHQVRNFLTRKCTEAEAYRRTSCFIDALFQHTHHTLESEFDSKWGIGKVTSEFRIRMTAGQTVKEPNEFRRGFYQQVVLIAEEKLKVVYVFFYLGYIRRLKVFHLKVPHRKAVTNHQRTPKITTFPLLPPAENLLNT